MTIIHKSKESRIFKKLGATFGNYRHSSIYAVNVGTHKKNYGKQKPRKSRLLSSSNGEENRIEL